MMTEKKERKFSQIGAYVIVIAFILFLYADVYIYHNSSILITMRILIILLFVMYILLSDRSRSYDGNLLNRLYMFNVLIVLFFMDYLIITKSFGAESDLNRSIQVAMAINLGVVLFSEAYRKYIVWMILANLIIVLGIHSVIWGNIVHVFFTYFNLIAFNMGLCVFNRKFLNAENAEASLTMALSQKVNELEVELAIQEMLELELIQKANYDRMTELLNRTEGIKVLNDFFTESQKKDYPLSVCYMDLNNLKKINDSWGHEVGDRYILDFVGVLKSTIRNKDICVRMGGDEFLIILNNVAYEDAHQIWAKIQSNMDVFHVDKQRQYELSVSHGICERTKCDAVDANELIRCADERMFVRKKRMKQ